MSTEAEAEAKEENSGNFMPLGENVKSNTIFYFIAEKHMKPLPANIRF